MFCLESAALNARALSSQMDSNWPFNGESTRLIILREGERFPQISLVFKFTRILNAVVNGHFAREISLM